MEAPRPQRVLALRRGAIGDSICFLPVLAAVRARAPGAQLSFAGEEAVADLFADRGLVDRGFSSERLALWRLDGSEVRRRECLQELDDYDWLVGDLGPRGLLADHRGERTAFDVVVDENGRQPASHQLLERARAVWPWAWPSVRPEPRIPSPRGRQEDRVWIHPGSGSSRKNWEGLARIVELAVAGGNRVTVSFGEADGEVRSRLEPHLPREVERCEGLALHELARELERSGLYLGNDSGITHLAAALGIPSVAVFVTTRPEVWAPRGSHSLAIDLRSSGEEDPTDVWRRAVELRSDYRSR